MSDLENTHFDVVSEEHTQVNEEHRYDAEFKLTAEILPIVLWPNERLNTQCEDVTEFDIQLEQHVLNMYATMVANNGVGLAAPQVGIMKNIIVLRLETDLPQVFVNPKIINTSEEMYEWEEGCLSVPGYFETRKRPKSVVFSYQDIYGEHLELEFRNLYAFALQHEIDHLSGKLFIDDAGFVKKNVIKRKMKKHINNVK